MVEEAEKSEKLQHDEIRDRIVELGNLLRFVGEKEYRVHGRRLDAVWKQNQAADPSYSFEVVATKDNDTIDRALSRSKDALECWVGVQLFIVTAEDIKQKVREHASNSYREIEKIIQIVTPEEAMNFFMGFKSLSSLALKFGVRIHAAKKAEKTNGKWLP